MQYCPGISKLFIRGLILLASVSACTAVQAQFSLEFLALVEGLDNPVRLPDSEDTEIMRSLSATVQLQRQARYVDTNFQYNAVREEYAEDLLLDQSRVEGSGELLFKLVPDRFSWSVQNSRSNQLVDISLPGTVNNQQVIDFTSTGPRLSLLLDAVSTLSISADWGIVDYAGAEQLNQDRNIYNFGINRFLRPDLYVGISSSYTEAEYDILNVLDFESSRATATIGMIRDTLSVSIEAGEQRTRRSGVKFKEPIVTVNAQYALNSRMDLTAEYAESVEDLLGDLQASSVVDQSLLEADIQLQRGLGNSDNSNLYLRRVGSVGLAYSGDTGYRLGVRFSKRDRRNLISSQMETDERATFSMQLPVSNRWTFDALIGYSELGLVQPQSDQERLEFSLSGVYRLTDNMSLRFAVYDMDQEGTLFIDNYKSTTASIGLLIRR